MQPTICTNPDVLELPLQKTIKQWTISAALLAVTACVSSADTKSTSVTNEGIQAKLSVTEVDSGSARLNAELNAGGSI